jgi:2-octaprenyl-6-methoxyphenol hydroxylase
MVEFTALIAGAGPAGLAAAALLAKEGVATALVAPPSTDDPRTVALMQPSIQLLRYLDIWPGSLETVTSPLRRLRIIDDTGSLLTAPNLEFDAQELNLEAFGWNIPLSQLLPALRKRAEDLGVTFIEATAANAKSKGHAIHLTLSNASEISASVCIAADGANSAMRTAAGISTDALVLWIRQPSPASHPAATTIFRRNITRPLALSPQSPCPIIAPASSGWNARRVLKPSW